MEAQPQHKKYKPANKPLIFPKNSFKPSTNKPKENFFDSV